MNENTRLPIRDGGREAVPDGLWGRQHRQTERIIEPVVLPVPLTERLLRRFRSLPRGVQRAAGGAFLLLTAVCLAGLMLLLVRAAGGAGVRPGSLPPDGGNLPAAAASEQTDTDAASAAPAGTVPDIATAAPETDTAPTADPETETQADPEPTEEPTSSDPEPSAPDLPDVPGTVRRDVSESERGARYLHNAADRDPLSLPAYVPEAAPAVLLVCSQPYAAYADGDGGGTVGNLTEELAALLRAQGLPVVCVSAQMTGLSPNAPLADCRARVQALARYCCRLYGNVTLIIDLRRSAETAEGCLLAAAGQLDGQPAAQLRLIADARRTGADGLPDRAASDADCALALALREALYRISPTVSRPVLWRASEGLVPSGLCGAGDAPRLLTVEAGAAGNRYAEAQASLGALAEALVSVLMQ